MARNVRPVWVDLQVDGSNTDIGQVQGLNEGV